jgi:hypothetical protein
MAFQFPYDVNELLGGRARILIAPSTQALPTALTSIIAVATPYAAATGWVEIGATGGPAQYSRNITVSGYDIQQSTSAVLEEVQDVTRTIAFPAAEIRSDNLQLFEGSDVADITGTQDRVRFGTIVELSSHRIAIIGIRKKVQGVTADTTRGRLVALVGFNVTISADNAQASFGEGEMMTLPLSFTFHPDPVHTTRRARNTGCGSYGERVARRSRWPALPGKAEITLGLGDGTTVVPVYEQSVPYLLHRVAKFIDALQGLDLDGDTSTDTVLAVLGGQAYQALCALVPNLPQRVPEHTFRGFATVDQMAAGEFDEDAAMRAPSMGQIRQAFKVAIDANGLDMTGPVG